MTLGRRLILTLSLMFLAMLVGVEAIYLRSAQRHLQDQLESHAQDAATSLGLSLGIVLARGDNAMAETVINAAFDRGFYERVEFLGPEGGAPLVSRRLPVEATDDYPAWFATLFPLDSPTAESLVSSGWRQLGKVRVTSHPRFAYLQFWSTARNTFAWLAGIYVVALVLLRFFLRSVLQPLRDVEAAAEAIARRDFVTVSRVPGTRELARVVTAMNTLSGKVRAAIEAETERATRLQQAADYDGVSGLLNRNGFAVRFASRYRDEAQSFSGVLALFKLSNMARVNEARGEREADALIAACGRVLAEAAGVAGLAGRWVGALFVIVLPDEGASRRLEEIRDALAAAVTAAGADAQDVGIQLGAIACDRVHADLDSLFAAADAQLQSVLTGRSVASAIKTVTQAAADDPDSRLRGIREAIEAGRVGMVAQSVHAARDSALMHLEIMGRLLDASGREMPAAEFMPLVDRAQLGGALDMAVIRAVIAGAREQDQKRTFAVNLSPQSLRDPAFIDWIAHGLPAQLATGFAGRHSLVCEISERGVFGDIAAAVRLGGLLREAGAALAVDHFGLHPDSLSLVRRLRPAYLKLSAMHTTDILDDPGKQFFVEAVVRAAAQLDVPVIAQGVESSEVLAAYRDLGVSGYQGYVSGRPVPWPPATAS
jgi:EAL domain-containing protein (putative c-di-GMP-specific phosphodiesterase class I)/GGDEF domain-containing protein